MSHENSIPVALSSTSLTNNDFWSSMMSPTLMKYRGSHMRMQHSSSGLNVAV